VLVIEDNPADVFIMREALSRQGLDFLIESVADGESALEYLGRESEKDHGAVPDLIILDLNFPKVGGPEVLRFIRRAPKLSKVCVVVLSSSPQDVIGDIAAEASCYMEKPASLKEFLAIGGEIVKVLNQSKAV
jgi:CheY-like chemotaxis protein